MLEKPMIDPDYMINYKDKFYINLTAHNEQVSKLKKELKTAQKNEEAPETIDNKQSTPIFCPDCKSDQVNYKCGNCDYTFTKW